MHRLTLFLTLFFSSYTFCQNHSGEIGLVLDNDLFTSTVNDQYYTSGTEIFYRSINRNENTKINKKIIEFKLGHQIYTPSTLNTDRIEKHDRPFAGYLFGEIGVKRFYHSESVLSTGIQIGVVGKLSQAENLQKLFHKTFGIGKIKGWNLQIHDALAVQGNILYSTKLLKNKTSKRIDLHFKGEVEVGTVLNGISVGPLARISLRKSLLPIYNSNLHGASLNNDPSKYREQKEFYFYVNPKINYQIYDATIQGSMFNDDSPVTFDLIPLRLNIEAGFKYRQNHWNFHYIFIYRGKEVDHPRNKGYFYGSIGASYLL